MFFNCVLLNMKELGETSLVAWATALVNTSAITKANHIFFFGCKLCESR